MNETRIPKSVNQQQATVTAYDLRYVAVILTDEASKQAAKVARLQEKVDIERDKLAYVQNLIVKLNRM